MYRSACGAPEPDGRCASCARRAWTCSRSRIRGRTIARSFWGRGWCEHLESFSDYANRLPRGRTYVRNGSVCHLANRARRRRGAGRRAGSLPRRRAHQAAQAAGVEGDQECVRRTHRNRVLELLQGRLSDRVMEVVIHRDNGLFPQPGEIKLACDCPDWATMCKHAAAVLYGVGSRLDTSPELLFRLRGVDEAELIAADMALPRGTAAADTLADGDLGGHLRYRSRSGGGRARAEHAEAGGEQLTQAGEPEQEEEDATSWLIERWCHRRAHRRTARTVRVLGRRVRRTLLRVSGATVRRWEATPGPLDLRTRPREALTALRRENRAAGRLRAPCS